MTQLSPTALEEAAKAISISTGDEPHKLTYAHEMQCTGRDREPKYRWQYWTEQATAAITAYLAQREKEGFVEVPLNLARRVTSIARRNEDAPEIHELSTLLTAAQNGGEPCK